VGKINIPVMGWHIGTFDLVAQVTQVTLVDHLPVVIFIDTIDFQGLGFIDEIEKGGKGVAQGHTTPATMAYVVDTLQLFKQWSLVVKVRILPFQRMAGGCLETAFT
jgi:hypothetical protein